MSPLAGHRSGGAVLALLVASLAAGGCGDQAPPVPAAPMASAPVAPRQATPAASAAAASAAAAATHSVSADRLPAPVVPPVERNGVVYAQAENGRDLGLAQVGGVLVASEAGGGKRLWTLAVYPNPIDTRQEADAQWIFFRAMAFDADGRLRIVNEAGKSFLVDVGTRQVTPAP